MNCLPMRPFPIPSSVPPPITFSLPAVPRSSEQPHPCSSDTKADSSVSCPRPVRQEDVTACSDEKLGGDEDTVFFSVIPTYCIDENGDPVLDELPVRKKKSVSNVKVYFKCQDLRSRSVPRLSTTTLASGYAHYFAEFMQGATGRGLEPSSLSSTRSNGGEEEEVFAELVDNAAKVCITG
ncbi:unnamed protein product [Gongylonema pulchrum]|uniref:Kinesin motor domain-containing protein n=1 Tax=Gongylonema pulchrum TaxID=637853 RepID=A0A183D8W7_9BILA|nr:unnamed protein product [Gongylonema pulchrum]